MTGTAAMSYRKRFKNAARNVFHLRRGRGYLKYADALATTQIVGLVALAAPLGVQLIWTPQYQADTYKVEKSANGTTGWSTVSDAVPRGAQGYLVTGLTYNVIQYFRVSAVNTLGAGTVSANVSATPTEPVAAPSPIANLAATNGILQSVLSWTAATYAVTYTVEKSLNGVTWTVVSAAIDGALETYTATGLTAALTLFRITAVGNFGSSAVSNLATATPTAS